MLYNICVYFAVFTVLLVGAAIYKCVDEWMMDEEDCN